MTSLHWDHWNDKQTKQSYYLPSLEVVLGVCPYPHFPQQNKVYIDYYSDSTGQEYSRITVLFCERDLSFENHLDTNEWYPALPNLPYWDYLSPNTHLQLEAYHQQAYIDEVPSSLFDELGLASAVYQRIAWAKELMPYLPSPNEILRNPTGTWRLFPLH